jgi:NADPH:quinone reductase-like Zn-dependent oxidoreductase
VTGVMRSYHVDSGAGLSGLAMREHPDPSPGPGEAVVAVRATSLSFRELMVLRGDYVLPVKPDVVPVSDGAGEVVAVGEGVTRVQPGDRVTATLFPRWLDGPFRRENAAQIGGSLDGMLTELAVLNEEALVQVPEHLSFAEAATLPCAGVTAWNALTGGRRLLAGETVLTLGSGGVSLFALQFAKVFGARVIATTGSEDKRERLVALGADAVVNYRTTPEWHEAVRDLTGGRGVDHVVDVAGTLEQSLRSVAVGGQVACVGFVADGERLPIDPAVLFASGATIRVVAVGSRAQFAAMNQAIAANLLRPVIDRVFSFDDALSAYRYYQSGQAFGKVVIGS